jgi:hypothetical protein
LKFCNPFSLFLFPLHHSVSVTIESPKSSGGAVLLNSGILITSRERQNFPHSSSQVPHNNGVASILIILTFHQLDSETSATPKKMWTSFPSLSHTIVVVRCCPVLTLASSSSDCLPTTVGSVSLLLLLTPPAE